MKKVIAMCAILAAAFVTAEARLPKEEPNEHYLERAAMFKKEGVKPGSIVFLGDSQTEGGDWATLTGIPDVVTRGIIGDTAEGIAERLTDVTSGKPSKIFLLCGVNDVSHAIPADSVAMSIIEVVKRIHAETPETKVYLQSLLPINNSFGRYSRIKDKEPVVREINAILAAEAPSLDVTWINLYPLFTDSEQNLRAELTSDGLHLKPEGYSIWGSIIKPYATE